ncbi:PstS family phosphate ABC transporter substrate-binding protein [Lederbergia citrea]|uniref:Substrate-binding domain-containing protein n=1 Tax=Lederbergia citrea TaxID=2833581 RepID=A0A942Z4C5_9BACI|nr:substrate-binding domain-containing protein [Lederbergia citrea]MBS4206063.1 substrate-binding domain-containing protein [Lederbergia citrea]MBS4224488.1 substrate-binding domain-containing protein [Lederbergia citrea]
MGYKLRIWLFYCGILPFAFSFVTLFVMGDMNMLPVITCAMLITGLAAGFFAASSKQLPANVSARYFPVVLPTGYTLVLWAIFMLISGGFYGNSLWVIYVLLHLPFVPIGFIASFSGIGILYFLAPLAYNAAFLLGFLLKERIRKPKPTGNINKKQLLSFSFVIILAIGVGSFVQWHRSQTVLPSYGFEYGGGYSSTDLWPYDISNPENQLPKLSEPATFTIKDKYLILDGAEAAFPVYSAFAQAAYKDMNLEGSGEFVSFTNTIYAYERLLDREVDIYFGAEPSADQLKMAEEQGRELIMTPIGKEAFVFFVNQKNPVDHLQVSEIQGIYSGDIQNWNEVGGNNEKIIAFQRPKNSGSQTLLEKIMGDKRLIKPLKEDVPEGMGGIIEQVADYRNYENALGFSFRFFATGMNKNSDLKFLAIDGVEPNSDNISSGTYPFTANLYAISLKDNPKATVEPFLEWMQGPQGQKLVEEVGYIKLEEQ